MSERKKNKLDTVTGDVQMNSDVVDQLTVLQEQLVATMIENETIQAELDEYKSKINVEKLIKELEYERDRNKQLSQKLKLATTKIDKSKEMPRSNTPIDADHQKATLSESQIDDENPDITDGIGSSNIKDSVFSPASTKNILPENSSDTWSGRACNCLASYMYELLADFTDDPDPEQHHIRDNDPLSVKHLKENVTRFKSQASRIFRIFQGIYNLIIWDHPLSTAVTFAIYMYAVWNGWLIPVVLFLAILRLSINYLIKRGWNVQMQFLTEPKEEEEKQAASADVALSDRFLLVVNVARHVQNSLGDFADRLEKLKNLFTWQQPDVTMEIMLVLCVIFVLSCVLSGTTLAMLFGMYMGIKLFIFEYIFERFPRFRQRHDSTYKMWRRLPTDAELIDRKRLARIDWKIIGGLDASNESLGGCSNQALIDREITDADRNLCTLFDLPLNERPLPGWENGWRVTLIDKTKPFLKSLNRNGRLYLTNSFLCMERSKSSPSKNILIPLNDITRLEKIKPYTWLPGAGMSIEIHVTGFEQPYTFGAIVNRDECFNLLMAHGSDLHLPWAEGHVRHSSGDDAASETSDAVDKTSIASHGSSDSGMTSYRWSALRAEYDDPTTFGE